MITDKNRLFCIDINNKCKPEYVVINPTVVKVSHLDKYGDLKSHFFWMGAYCS